MRHSDVICHRHLINTSFAYVKVVTKLGGPILGEVGDFFMHVLRTLGRMSNWNAKTRISKLTRDFFCLP